MYRKGGLIETIYGFKFTDSPENTKLEPRFPELWPVPEKTGKTFIKSNVPFIYL